MKKIMIITAAAAMFALSFVACTQDGDNTQQILDTTIPQQSQCDHYDMDVDNFCDDCGEAMIVPTQPRPTETKPDYGTALLALKAEYTLGAYSSGATVMNLYDSNVLIVESIVDTSSVGQGEQVIRETGTWTYDQENDTYTLAIRNKQYTMQKNEQGKYQLQYAFVMKGQTGGTQDIAVTLIQTSIE